MNTLQRLFASVLAFSIAGAAFAALAVAVLVVAVLAPIPSSILQSTWRGHVEGRPTLACMRVLKRASVLRSACKHAPSEASRMPLSDRQRKHLRCPSSGSDAA